MTGTQEKVLAAVRAGARTVTSISEVTGMSHGELYPILAQLERRELISSRFSGDRRLYAPK